MRDMRYGSSSYGAPPPNYAKTPFGGDSYRPDRDRDPSPNMPYYERDRLDDRDFYSSRRTPVGGGGSGPSSSNNPDYDRYRGGGGGRGRPNWGPKFSEDRSNRLLDRDRPEKINTAMSDAAHIKSEKSSPTSAVTVQSTTSQKERDDKTEDMEQEEKEGNCVKKKKDSFIQRGPHWPLFCSFTLCRKINHRSITRTNNRRS